MGREWLMFSCGHEGWAHLFGPRADRWKLLAWYRSYGKCNRCFWRYPDPIILVNQCGDMVRILIAGAQPIEEELTLRGYRLDPITHTWIREVLIGQFPDAYRELRQLGAIPHPFHTQRIEHIHELVGEDVEL